jgi:3-oxocholest-4-en-26-oyl-CoA dehydrogenase beta subunit
MDFSLTDAQLAVGDLARRILSEHGGHEHAARVESAGGIDVPAWAALGSTGLLEAIAGEDGGVVAAAQLAAEVGRQVATVPAWALLTCLLVLGECAPDEPGTRRTLDGTELATIALHEVAVCDVRRLNTVAAPDGTVTGSKPAVAGLAAATRALVAASPAPEMDGRGDKPARADGRLYLVELGQPAVTAEPVRTTDRGSAAHLVMTAARAVHLGDEQTLRRAEQIAIVLVCATLIGLAERATDGAAAYISARRQFGRPISSFQAPLMRLADAHIDLEAMRVTMLRAAWCLDVGRDAEAEVSTAKWWAAEGGHRILHTAQHLHGGIGADVSYPAHRYFLRGKQLIDTLGGAAVHADRLGAVLSGRSRR